LRMQRYIFFFFCQVVCFYFFRASPRPRARAQVPPSRPGSRASLQCARHHIRPAPLPACACLLPCHRIPLLSRITGKTAAPRCTPAFPGRNGYAALRAFPLRPLTLGGSS